jgi:hypothetical protein
MGTRFSVIADATCCLARIADATLDFCHRALGGYKQVALNRALRVATRFEHHYQNCTTPSE